jgi:iron complex outermembrane receptor protein
MRLICLLALAASPSLALAQMAAPPAPGAAQAPATAEETVALPAFSITTERDTGYVGTEALSTTRVGVPLTDLSQSVMVLNRAFIDAIDPTIVSKSLLYVGGAQTGTISWSVDRNMIRGFVGEGDYVDGFRTQTDRNTDLNLIDHIEVIKGPSAIFIGNTANTVGGVINKISKSPTDFNEGSVTVQVGEFDAAKFDVDIGGPITADKKLMYRVLFLGQDSLGYYNFTYDKRMAVTGMLEYKFTNDTEAWIKAEKFDCHYSSYNGIPISGQTANGLPMGQGGIPIPGVTNRMLNLPYDINLNENNPLNWRTDWFYRIWGQFTTRPNDHLAIRLAVFDSADWQRRVESILSIPSYVNKFGNTVSPGAGGSISTDPVTGKPVLNPSYVISPTFIPGTTLLNRAITGINADYQPRREAQNDYVFNFITGPASHKLLIGLDAIDFPETTSTYSGIGTASPINPYNPIYPGTVTDNINQQPPPSFLDQSQTFAKIYGMETASFLDNRVILSWGAARNRVEIGKTSWAFNNVTQVTTPTSVPNQVLYKNLVQYGLLVKPLPNISLFYGQNQNFANNGFDTNNHLQPPQQGSQHEIGIKSNLLHNKVTANISYFDIKQLNNSVPAFPQTVPPSQTLVPGTVSRGFDGDFTAQLTHQIDLMGAFSYFKAHVPLPAPYSLVNQPIDGTVYTDLPVDNVSQHSYSISTRYKFTGMLKGFAVGVSANYLAKRAITDNSNQEFYGYVPARTLCDALLSYDMEQFKIQLNIDNLFNKKFIYAARSNQVIVPGTPINFRVMFTYKFF